MRVTTAGTAGQRGMTEDERHYYALNARVYPYLSRFYNLVTFPFVGLRRAVARLTGVDERSNVLDVATGTGAQALAFAGRAAQVVGVDISEPMLRVARRRNRFANLRFLAADATALPFPDAAFDVSCISFALHEMPGSVRDRTLREMARVTRPGGTIVVVDYALPRNAVLRWLVYHFVKLYERDSYVDFVRSDLLACLRRAGLELLADRPVLLGAARIVTTRRPDAV